MQIVQRLNIICGKTIYETYREIVSKKYQITLEGLDSINQHKAQIPLCLLCLMSSCTVLIIFNRLVYRTLICSRNQFCRSRTKVINLITCNPLEIHQNVGKPLIKQSFIQSLWTQRVYIQTILQEKNSYLFNFMYP